MGRDVALPARVESEVWPRLAGFVLLKTSLFMRSNAQGFWGPHPAYALLPVLAIIGVSGWVWFANRGPLPDAARVAVTAMKPLGGAAADPAEMPIEVRYGVPTERTLHLWAPAA